MYINLLLGLAPLLGGADPTPVDTSIVEAVIADPTSSAPLCDSYREIVGMIGDLGMDSAGELVFVDLADAYLIVNIEGTDYRFDNEARDTFTGWLHSSCS